MRLMKSPGFSDWRPSPQKDAASVLPDMAAPAGISTPLTHCGTFLFGGEGCEKLFQIELYRADDYSGEFIETEEMRPEWFSIPPENRQSDGATAVNESTYPPIPFSSMWESDSIWFPLLLSKKHFIGRADFSLVEGAYKLRRWWFGTPKP
ncbi:hypothetical protein PLICRDRAFT_51431 [Plicaturopsis crispa FD-325 SS-3]|nr:hypothetical protein PLICRDRAFT_51431 [Plicaturopsis crispa FD-325 SS-3]